MAGETQRRRVTINDIARISGVSKSTVSAVINGDPKSIVKRKTFDHVKQVIDRCGYNPLPQARALSLGRTRHIGLLISSTAQLGLANSYFSLILAGVEAACSEYNYFCVVNRYNLASLQNMTVPTRLRQTNVDALIVAGNIGPVGNLLSLQIPVTILGYCESEKFYRVDRGNHCLGALKHLAELGHQNILIPYYNAEELMDFQQFVERFNLGAKKKVNVSYVAKFTELGDLDRGKVLCREVFVNNRFPECTAMIANDQICCGFLQEIRALGFDCPKDFSLIARDDTAFCEWNAIPITACGGNLHDYGYAAAKAMIELLETGQEPDGRLITLNPEKDLIVRATTGPARFRTTQQK